MAVIPAQDPLVRKGAQKLLEKLALPDGRKEEEVRRMKTVAQEMPAGLCAPCEIGTLGAFFQPSINAEKMGRSEERLIGELVTIVDRELLFALDSRSADEFTSIRRRVLPRYVRALRALHDTATNLISDDTLEQISEMVVADLSADLEKQELRFGGKLIEQSVFTLWTMQKIRCLAIQICKAGDVSAEKKFDDNALFHEYQGASLWAQFHLDLLFVAMKFTKPIDEQLKEAICDGLRASVNAYAIMKDALYLRRPLAKEQEYSTNSLPWDEEDEELLALSMGLNAKPSER